MNGLDSIVASLAPANGPTRRPTGNLTEGLRSLLREAPATCAELSVLTGIPRTTVSALLAAGIRRGHLAKDCDGRYSIRNDYEDNKISAAIHLLESRGFTVTKSFPGSTPPTNDKEAT